MDLLATVRKEGSRGGAGNFKWSDVQNSTRREHYLGHSVMAPVGRWQKGRDLNWYAKSGEGEDGDEDAEEKAARERREELRRVKEVEEDALARALGLPVAPRNNANMEPVSDKREVDKAIKETTGDGDGGGKGIGYGSLAGKDDDQILDERIEGNAEAEDKQLKDALKEYQRRHGNSEKRHRSRSRDRERHRHSGRDREHHHRRRYRSRSRDRDQNKRHRSPRSRSRSRDRDSDRHRYRPRDRSRSPHRHRRSEGNEHSSYRDRREAGRY